MSIETEEKEKFFFFLQMSRQDKNTVGEWYIIDGWMVLTAAYVRGSIFSDWLYASSSLILPLRILRRKSWMTSTSCRSYFACWVCWMSLMTIDSFLRLSKLIFPSILSLLPV